AELSWLTTFPNRDFRYACASAGLLPSFSCAPYPAMMFQRAPPEVKGLGVTTCTPGLTRSAQPVMCLGLPLRTMITTTELVTKPCVAFWFQLGETRPAFTSRSTSPSSEKLTTSACRPFATERLCSPEGP